MELYRQRPHPCRKHLQGTLYARQAQRSILSGTLRLPLPTYPAHRQPYPPATFRSGIGHPALSYFARDYGLHQISIEEGGKEPSPAHLKELIDLCKSEKVNVIFVQPEFDKRNAETIAQQTGTKVVPINPLSYDWETEMLNVAKALTPMDPE